MASLKYKICMVGLGSIGKRHLRNIIKVLNRRDIAYEIDALRSSRKCLNPAEEDLITKEYYNADDLPDDYDVMFITNPTHLHYAAIDQVSKKTRHMFIEKPVFDKCTCQISQLHLNPQGIYYVACPLRHKEIIQYVKNEILTAEKIISCRIISSSYLPEWRSGTDYRKSYSAHTDMGGGVTRDLIHEWDYAVYLFGKPIQRYNLRGHFSDLEIDSDDLSVYIARYEQMLLEIHLDYLGRKTERKLELFTNNKRYDIDLVDNVITEYCADKTVLKKNFGQEDFYVNEMEYFIDCIEGKCENMNTIEEAYETLKIALDGER